MAIRRGQYASMVIEASRQCIACALMALIMMQASARVVAAQGFARNDLYLVSRALPTGAGVVRIDPLTGATSLVLSCTDVTERSMPTYDPFRDRIFLTARMTATSLDALWIMDATGAVIQAPVPGPVPIQVAARGDGKVYLWSTGPTFRYLAADDTVHDVLDASGVAPFQFLGPGSAIFDTWIYEPRTNSLFTASDTFNGQATCGSPEHICVRKLQLSLDGRRVIAPVASVDFCVRPNDQHESPEGFSFGPNGSLLLVIDDNFNDAGSSGCQGRVVLIDPVTMSVSTYADPGPYVGAAACNAGLYDPVIGAALVLDTGNDVLRRFSLGGTGTGSIFASSGLSRAPGSGEHARLIRVSSGWPRFRRR